MLVAVDCSGRGEVVEVVVVVVVMVVVVVVVVVVAVLVRPFFLLLIGLRTR